MNSGKASMPNDITAAVTFCFCSLLVVFRGLTRRTNPNAAAIKPDGEAVVLSAGITASCRVHMSDKRAEIREVSESHSPFQPSIGVAYVEAP
jgi:hypothetical protein